MTICRRVQMSVTNCCMIGDLISQNLSLIAPSIPSAVQYQCKSNSFPVCLKSVSLVRNMSLSCQNKSNSFCYVCSEVVLKSQRKSLSELVRKAYELYFGCEVGDDKLGAEDLLEFMFKDFDRCVARCPQLVPFAVPMM